MQIAKYYRIKISPRFLFLVCVCVCQKSQAVYIFLTSHDNSPSCCNSLVADFRLLVVARRLDPEKINIKLANMGDQLWNHHSIFLAMFKLLYMYLVF